LFLAKISRKSKKPRSAHTGRGLVFFPNSLTASGVRTATNNNAVGNYLLEHGAKVGTVLKCQKVEESYSCYFCLDGIENLPLGYHRPRKNRPEICQRPEVAAKRSPSRRRLYFA
jgi:hypothetical protein